MDRPELYVKVNDMQRRGAKDVLSKYVEQMIWTSDETILDLGCGPGDVTNEIIEPILKNKINHLVGYL